MDDLHFTLVAEAMLEGRVIPFLGSGASRSDRVGNQWTPGAGLPDGYELARYLAQVAKYRPEDRRSAEEAEAEEAEPSAPLPLPPPPPLEQVSLWIEAFAGEDVLYDHLHEAFASDYGPTSVHRFLARLSRVAGAAARPRVIVTSNYDDAMEQAFDDERLEYDLVWYQVPPEENAQGAFVHRPHRGEPVRIDLPDEYDGLDPGARTTILKIHGAVDRASADNDSYVITEDNYINFFGETDPFNQIPSRLRSELTRGQFLFLGYGLRDWNLRVLFNRIWSQRKRRSVHWAIQHRPSRMDTKLWLRRANVEVFDIPLSEYVERLEAQLTLPAGTAAPG